MYRDCMKMHKPRFIDPQWGKQLRVICYYSKGYNNEADMRTVFRQIDKRVDHCNNQGLSIDYVKWKRIQG